MDAKLYVGNLSYSTTETDLKTIFSKAGQVVSVALIKDRDSGRSKGFAFVEMSNQVEAEQAIRQFNGFNLGERALKVNLAIPREDRGSKGFGNRGDGYNKDRRGRR